MQPIRRAATQFLMRVVAHRDDQVIGSQHTSRCAVRTRLNGNRCRRATATAGRVHTISWMRASRRKPPGRGSTLPRQPQRAATEPSCACTRTPPVQLAAGSGGGKPARAPGTSRATARRRSPSERTRSTTPASPSTRKWCASRLDGSPNRSASSPGATSPSIRRSTIANRDSSPSAACTLTRLGERNPQRSSTQYSLRCLAAPSDYAIRAAAESAFCGSAAAGAAVLGGAYPHRQRVCSQCGASRLPDTP